MEPDEHLPGADAEGRDAAASSLVKPSYDAMQLTPMLHVKMKAFYKNTYGSLIENGPQMEASQSGNWLKPCW